MNNNDKSELENLYIKILEENHQLLIEMIVVGDEKDDYNIIAYKSKIWKLNKFTPNIDDKVLDDIYQTLGYRIGQIDTIGHIQGMIINMNYGNNEMLFGSMKNGELIIDDKKFAMIKSPQESVLFKKVVETLHPINITFTSDKLKTIDRSLLDRRVDSDKIFYHGTSSNYIIPIMRWGLDKDTANSNFPAAVKDLIKGRTFITSNFQYAFSHAVNTSKKQNGWPIVLSFRIRFEDLLQPDYDIRRDAPNNEKALKISREMGIYGYGGKIMPMDFETVYYSIYKHFNSDQYSSDEIRHEDAQYIYWLITTKGMNFENIVTYIS